jgi:hypothetical protein
MPIAPVHRHERPHEHQPIDPVSLDTTRASVDLQTGRVQNPALKLGRV